MQSRPDSADLVDLVAQSAAAEAEADGAAANGANDGRPAKRQRIYADHWPLSKIEDGIKRSTLHQVGRRSRTDAQAACEQADLLDASCGLFDLKMLAILSSYLISGAWFSHRARCG